MAPSRWIRPEVRSSTVFSRHVPDKVKEKKILISVLHDMMNNEVFPLFASVGVAVGICGMQLLRNITTNPDVRVTKENRAAGVLDNFKEGEKYAEHGLRKYVRNRTPQIMPSLNGFFSDPDLPTN
ncbi:hypothetical protein POTOM_035564 [Populus tomentosa]|uniref:B12D protein n=1 Tax=Populus tomentosa TaxID=118781 RepID=A0A8X8CMB5_POPTO|nr:hypothetical protein POTOM_035564 [Populus tomentosa]